MSRQANDQEKPDGRDRKPKPHEMGMQVPHCVHTERSKKGLVRPVEEGTASGVSRISTTQGMRDGGRAHDGGPRSHVDIDTAKVVRVAGGGLHQREKCDVLGEGLQ